MCHLKRKTHFENCITVIPSLCECQSVTENTQIKMAMISLGDTILWDHGPVYMAHYLLKHYYKAH